MDEPVMKDQNLTQVNRVEVLEERGRRYVRLSAVTAERNRAQQACERMRRRIAELEGEVRDLRQRLIGGVEGTLSATTVRSEMLAWAEANDRWLRETAPRIANYDNPEQ